MRNKNKELADFFSGKFNNEEIISGVEPNKDIDFSYLFFSDVRKEISNKDKYSFTRDLVEFSDQNRFKAIYFPERHFYEFGSVYADNSVMGSYFSSITKNVRLRSAAVSITLHHPAKIVESWAMIDILSNGRVDLGFGSGWNESDFILSPDTFENRVELRNERIPIVQKLWAGETLLFKGPKGNDIPITVYPRPIQPTLNVWYVTNSEFGFKYAGSKGYNIFTMLYGIDLNECQKRIEVYRKARQEAGLDPSLGIVTLMLHTLVNDDEDLVNKTIEKPFKDYIRSSLLPQLKSSLLPKAKGEYYKDENIDQIVDYAYARYVKTAGVFGSIENSKKMVKKAMDVGINEIAFLQDFGMDYDVVRKSLPYLEALVKSFDIKNKKSEL